VPLLDEEARDVALAFNRLVDMVLGHVGLIVGHTLEPAIYGPTCAAFCVLFVI
jgi:hypothetical protein